jgi:hypothetical protein
MKLNIIIGMDKNMRKTIILFICMLLLPIGAFADTSRDAIRSLKKIEAYTQIGISNAEYVAALRDAQYEVNLYFYLDNPDLKKEHELAVLINQIMEGYVYAGNLWKKGEWIHLRDAAELLKKYPEISHNTDIVQERTVQIQPVIAFVWGKASADLKKAQKYILKNSVR